MQVSDVFTPLNEARTERLTFNMSDVKVLEGDLDERRVGHKATVEIGRKQYAVFGAGCGLGRCCCDAYIREIAEQPRRIAAVGPRI